MGDLSENGAYKYAKFEISDINRRLRQIRHLLTYGVIHIPKKQSIIDFGSTIELKTPNGMIMSYTLVSEHESDPAKHKLSLKSPIGQATLGKKAGDQISVNTPSGTKTFIITKVS
jgi:transcription elongation GreA/GreB family factor